MQLNALPMPMFGAEVTGWDFAQPADELAKEELRALLLQYKMLLFPPKILSPGQLTDFARVFGDSLAQSTDPYWWHSDEHQMIYKVTNQLNCVASCACEGWHCDGHYLRDPMGITIMNQVAAAGGGIDVADLSLAYESLSDAKKASLKSIRCFNDSGVAQPLVLKHPVTGRMGLYINMYAKAVDASGKALPEIDAEMDKLLHEYKYKHMFQGGDIMVIDNLAVVHKACPASPEAGNETLHRCQTSLSRTWWRQKKQPVAVQSSQANRVAAEATA